MGSDFWLVVQWWGTLFLVGAVAFPLTKYLFGINKDCKYIADRQNICSLRGWYDYGYFFSKAVGIAVATWIVYVIGTVHLLPFTPLTIFIALFIVFIGGIALSVFSSQLSDFGLSVRRFTGRLKTERPEAENRKLRTDNWFRSFLIIFLEEIFFFAALLLWSWVKGHEPSIHGLEKFMDFGIMKSILNSQYFPPADMWYAGLPVNYYYFGHMVVAVLTKLSGIDLIYTFNLMLATIFAFTLTMSFSIGYQLMSNKREVISEKHENEKLRSFLSLISYHLSPFFAGFLTAFLVTLAGNMQTLYAFTKGYTGDNVKPFWELAWNIREIGGIGEIWGNLGEGLNTYWYANATRFIPFTIHEFPSYSFVVSDVHGHVLSLPFTLLAIALLIQLFSNSYRSAHDSLTKRIGRTNTIFLQESFAQLIFYGFLVGVLLMTNALDGPIYFALLAAVLVIQNSEFRIQNWKRWKEKGTILLVVATVAGVTSIPFLFHFKSFVNGLAINCPPGFLANNKFGPFLFESVEKCQRSPVWMMLLLWGFFLYCGGWLVFGKFRIKNLEFRMLGKTIESIKSVWNSYFTHVEKLLIVFFLFSLLLIIFPEFFYFKDIYPAHFRSNTMFKLGYQAFILFSIVSAFVIIHFLFEHPRESQRKFLISPPAGRAGNFEFLNKRTLFFIFLIPQLFLVSIYPIFSVRSYFDSLRTYQGLDGLTWLKRQYPDDWAAIAWLNKAISEKREAISENQTNQKSSLSLISYRLSLSALVEADGDSYTDYARFSAFTGIPSIIGWPVHEWLWRGSYDVVAPRREEVRKIYESEDMTETRQILEKYNVRYIVVGTLERQKYTNLKEWKFNSFGKQGFHSGMTDVYQVDFTKPN